MSHRKQPKQEGQQPLFGKETAAWFITDHYLDFH
jgi:hypothetical protein